MAFADDYLFTSDALFMFTYVHYDLLWVRRHFVLAIFLSRWTFCPNFSLETFCPTWRVPRGNMMAISRQYLGHYLAISCAYLGHISAIIWPYIEYILAISWAYLGLFTLSLDLIGSICISLALSLAGSLARSSALSVVVSVVFSTERFLHMSKS